MPSERPQINVRLTEEWDEALPELVERARLVLGRIKFSQSDAMMLGLDLLAAWLDLFEDKAVKMELLKLIALEVDPEAGKVAVRRKRKKAE